MARMHYLVACDTGETALVPYTAAEEAAADAREAADQAARMAQAAELAALRAAAAAHPDPVIQALAARLGL